MDTGLKFILLAFGGIYSLVKLLNSEPDGPRERYLNKKNEMDDNFKRMRELAEIERKWKIEDVERNRKWKSEDERKKY